MDGDSGNKTENQRFFSLLICVVWLIYQQWAGG
jgi:hypothetical protein